MAVTMDMLSVVNLPAPKGQIPSGMKSVALANSEGGIANTCPVVAVGGFTFWPMSYDDNRMSFGMVMYDPSWNVVNTQEMKGARYIYQITLNGTGETGSVTFLGQDGKSVQVPCSAFETFMLKNTISAQ